MSTDPMDESGSQRALALKSPTGCPPNLAHEGAASNRAREQPVNVVRGFPEGWLGLAIDQRRLFEASQDGWLLPPKGTGFVLGHEGFVAETTSARRNSIEVRLAFDPRKLPFPQACSDARVSRVRDGANLGTQTTRWAAPLSLHAVTKIEVSSQEHREHILAMARQFGNVALPRPRIEVGQSAATQRIAQRTAVSEEPTVKLPDRLDAVQGSMAMATWAVPRIDPWISVLHAALDGDSTAVRARTGALDASWLDLPWLVDEMEGSPIDQAALWRAAVSVLRCPQAKGVAPSQLADEIGQRASHTGGATAIGAWVQQTQRIAAADEVLSCAGWRESGAGLAIQLVLLRPDPIIFRTWTRDLPNLPPAVWWAAAALCGWSHGYRSLEVRFRGHTLLHEFHALRALAESWDGASDVLPQNKPPRLNHRHEVGCVSLAWGDTPVFRKPWQPRAWWYNVDLNNATNLRAAHRLASRLGWPCVRSLKGTLLVNGSDAETKARSVDLVLRNAQAIEIDHDEFRRCLATAAADISDLPPHPNNAPSKEFTGFKYVPNFITEEEEMDFVAQIDAAKWNSGQLKRRVQHYGWRYDYGERQIDESMHLGNLPDWAKTLGKRLVENGLMQSGDQGVVPDQVIVNEYTAMQGISRHIDQPQSFAEPVATISLLETWGMVFRRRGSKEKVEKALERRSVAVLTGDARYKWTHEIPSRKYERVREDGKRVERGRRISLTFRKARTTKATPVQRDNERGS